MTELATAGMASTDESAFPCVGPFPSVMGVLGYRGRAIEVLSPSLVLCRIGLWPERGFGELIWELPTLGLGHPSFWLGPTMG